MIEFLEDRGAILGMLLVMIPVAVAAWVLKGKLIEQRGDRVEVKDVDQ